MCILFNVIHFEAISSGLLLNGVFCGNDEDIEEINEREDHDQGTH